MEIFFKGEQNIEEAAESVLSILRLFKDRYQITAFKQMYLSCILMDETGQEVELVDDATNKAYQQLEVYHSDKNLRPPHRTPHLQLVIDNTKK